MPAPTDPWIVVATDSALHMWAYGPFRTDRAAALWASQRNAEGSPRQYLALRLAPRGEVSKGEIAVALREAQELSTVTP